MVSPEIDPDAFNAFEASGWEEKAGGYDRLVGHVTSRFAGPLLDAANVTQGTRVLDLATGPGYVAAQAAERGASVVGVDVAGSDDRRLPGGSIRTSTSARRMCTSSHSRTARSTPWSATF